MDLLDKLPIVLIAYVAFLFSLCIHEASHATVAYLLKDDTAKRLGRMTLHPMAHISWVGTVIVPLVGFLTGWPIIGWAKPVPVDARNLSMKNKRLAYAIVSAAGPASNLLLTLLFLPIAALTARHLAHGFPQIGAAIFTAGLQLQLDQLHGYGLSSIQVVLMGLVGITILINLFLAFFNLLPIGPLDGSGVIRGLLPHRLLPKWDRIQPYLIVVLIIVIFSPLGNYLFAPVFWVVNEIILPIAAFILGA
jgi:Zn-dependent protease